MISSRDMPCAAACSAHSIVAYDTGVKLPKPGVSRYRLIDYLIHPRPCQTITPVFSHDRASVRGRMVPTRVYPKSGRISALAAVRGRLRACTGTSSQRTDSDDGIVTTFIIKSDVVPCPWAGRRRFSVVEGQLAGQTGAGFGDEYHYECCN